MRGFGVGGFVDRQIEEGGREEKRERKKRESEGGIWEQRDWVQIEILGAAVWGDLTWT